MKIRHAIAMLLCLFIGAEAHAQVRVKGYFKKNGTYVAPHYRSSPNRSKYDNYSTKGNYNPYTGKTGDVDPYAMPLRTHTAPSYYTAPTYRSSQPWWNTAPPASAPATSYSVEQGKAALNRMGERLAREDPFYELRLPILLSRGPSIVATLPPAQWEEALEQLYWSIPATKSSAAPFPITPPTLALAAPVQDYPTSQACRDAYDAKRELILAATYLLSCARKSDYTDDCSREVRDVRDAGDDLQTAVADSDGDCS